MPVNPTLDFDKIEPLCPVFGECGGCQYQNIAYGDELKVKQKYLSSLFFQHFPNESFPLENITPSPIHYHYRSRLDMKFLKMRDGRMLMGFSPVNHNRIIEVTGCPLALPAISDFLPQLKQAAIEKLPPKYRNANLVVKSGDDGRVSWGGIGRRSLRMNEGDYLWVELNGKRVYFSLDTFFQANIAILPVLLEKIKMIIPQKGEINFYDLYGGVGLFGITLADCVTKVVLVEENVHSIALAKHNAKFHNLANFEIFSGRVEEVLPLLVIDSGTRQNVVMIDPPRQGLSLSVAQTIARTLSIHQLLYLSCHPESLLRDLQVFLQAGWEIVRIMPFDFFPRTQHIENLVWLQPK